MTYNLCKKVIENTTYKYSDEKDKMKVKLDVFLLNDRITEDEYKELTELLNNKLLEE